MDIRTYLSQGKSLLFNRAMDTHFATYPGRAGEYCERTNLIHPEGIPRIHCAYLQTDCRTIKTNTFAISGDLSDGNDGTICDIVNATCHLVQQVVQPYGAYVFTDLGSASRDHSRAPAGLYQAQAQWLLKQGVTYFSVKVLSGDEGLPELVGWLKEKSPDAFLMVSFIVNHSGMTSAGHLGSELYYFVSELAGVDAVGFSCVSGSRHLLKYIQTLELNDKPLTVMPNIGCPTVLGHRMVFGGQPNYFTGQTVQIVQASTSIVGDCCGTMSEHIAQTAQALKESFPKYAVFAPKKLLKPAANASNSLQKKLEAGKRAIAMELDPPADDDSTGFWGGVQVLWGSGADAVTIADCSIGRPRVDSSLLTCKTKRDTDIEPLPHMACRDRNLNATKVPLLGLSMEGVRNVLVVTGNPISTEDRNEVKSVLDFNLRKLTRFVHILNENTLRTPFRIYDALNLNARNFGVELRRAQEKEVCGVSGSLTQPVLFAEALDNLRLAHKTPRDEALDGTFPIASHRNACFLDDGISGIRVCGEIIHLYEGKDRDAAEALAVTVPTTIAKEIFPYTDSYYLMTLFRRVASVEHIVQNIQQSCVS